MSTFNERRIFAEFDSERHLRKLKQEINRRKWEKNRNKGTTFRGSFKRRLWKKTKHQSIESIKFILYYGFIILFLGITITLLLDMDGMTWKELLEAIEQELINK